MPRHERLGPRPAGWRSGRRPRSGQSPRRHGGQRRCHDRPAGSRAPGDPSAIGPGDHQLAGLQHRGGRADPVPAALGRGGCAQPGHRRPGLADPRAAFGQRAGLSDQPQRHRLRRRRGRRRGRPDRLDPRHPRPGFPGRPVELRHPRRFRFAHRQPGADHGARGWPGGAGGTFGRELGRHPGPARPGRPGRRQQRHHRSLRRRPDRLRGGQRGGRAADRPGQQSAGGAGREQRQDQRRRRAGADHRQHGARRGRRRHQHDRLYPGALLRDPKRRDRARRRRYRHDAGDRHARCLRDRGRADRRNGQGAGRAGGALGRCADRRFR